MDSELNDGKSAQISNNNNNNNIKKKRRGKKGSIQKRVKKTNPNNKRVGADQENKQVNINDAKIRQNANPDKIIKYRERKIHKITNSSVIVRLHSDGIITEKKINSSAKSKKSTKDNKRSIHKDTTQTINILASSPLMTRNGRPTGEEQSKADNNYTPDIGDSRKSRNFLKCFCCCFL